MTDQKMSLESALAEIDAVLKADHFSQKVAVDMMRYHDLVVSYFVASDRRDEQRVSSAHYAAAWAWSQGINSGVWSLSPSRQARTFAWVAAAKSSRRALKLTDRLVNPRHHEWFSQFSVYRRLSREWDDQ